MKWIITELFHPDEVSTAQILTDVAIEYAKSGEIHVLSGPSGYEKSYHSKSKDLNPKIVIHRVALPDLSKNNLYQRILRLFLLTVKMSFFIFKNIKRGDSVLQVTNPTFLILTTSLLKSLKGFKLDILIHDVFPENLIPAGIINKKSFGYKLLSKIYNNAYSKANRLIVLGEDMKQLMISKVNNKSVKVDIIPNWADDDIRPIPFFNRDEYLRINTVNKTVIGFAGNLGRVQGILEFLEIFLESNNSNLELVIIGDGALKNNIKDILHERQVKNVHLLGSKPRKEQLQFLNSCDIGLVVLKKGMKGLGVPSKTYNIMAAGKPLLYIGDKDSEIDNYVSDFDCGWSFDWENDNVSSFLKNFDLNTKGELIIKGLNSLQAVEKFFRKNIVITKF
jgi:glycosyltransferase involved in cell wall biosynthesis